MLEELEGQSSMYTVSVSESDKGTMHGFRGSGVGPKGKTSGHVLSAAYCLIFILSIRSKPGKAQRVPRSSQSGSGKHGVQIPRFSGHLAYRSDILDNCDGRGIERTIETIEPHPVHLHHNKSQSS